MGNIVHFYTKLGIYIFSFLLLLIFFPVDNFAQKVHYKSKKGSDGSSIKNDQELLIRNFTLVEDTIQKDSLVQPIDRQKTEKFYQEIKLKMSDGKISKELARLIFKETSQSEKVNQNGNGKVLNGKQYKKYEGRYIGNIYFKKLEVFGPEITDTTKQPKTIVGKTANNTHINTKNSVIKNNLIIKKGDKLKLSDLAENERIIRELSSIKDVRIYVLPRKRNKDTVDLLVVTKDVFSLAVDFNPKDISAGNLTVKESNLLGLGHIFENTILFDNKRPNKFGYSGSYSIPNIKGSFVNSRFSYADYFNKNLVEATVFKEFVTPEIKYAGGITVNRLSNLGIIKPPYREQFIDTFFTFQYTSNLHDAWLAREFKIGNEKVNERSRIIISSRLTNLNFSLRPYVDADSNRLYHNRLLFLGGIGFSTRNFFQSRLIYGYGRTEDIPYGNLALITFGKEYGEFYSRNYGGIRLARSFIFKNIGYFYGNLSYGGFFTKKTFEQGVFNLDLHFFSNLYVQGKYKFRQFLTMNYTEGIRRFDEEYIDINNGRGVRGFSSRYPYGKKRISLQLETVTFTPLNILDFNFALFSFCDFGLISQEDEAVYLGKLYQGYGIGLRIRNENLTFNTFQIRFAWYPVVPNNMTPFNLEASGIPVYKMHNFNINAPEVVKYE